MSQVSPDIYLLYHLYQKHGYDTTHYNELIEELNGIMTKQQIIRALHTLDDWGFTKIEYGETRPGWAGKLHRLDEKYATEYSFKTKPLNLEECEIVQSSNEEATQK